MGLKNGKVAKIESDLLKTNKDIALKISEFYECFYGSGTQTCLLAYKPL